MSTGRLEAFSDGVFAIAITLLVLQIAIPEAETSDLWKELGKEWPSFAAYGVSFWVIGILWVSHHAILSCIQRVDRGVLYLNLLVLFSIAFVPFPTALVAEHLDSSEHEEVAAALYATAMSLTALSFGLLWLYISRHRQKLGVTIPAAQIHRRSRVFAVVAPVYAVSIAIAFVNAEAVLVLNAALAIYYAFAGFRVGDEVAR